MIESSFEFSIPIGARFVKIHDAMTLRDGGTTCVSVEDAGVVKHVTFDHALPRDDRTRYVYVSDRKFNKEEGARLELDSSAEIRFITAIRDAAIEELGPAVVEEFLKRPRIESCRGIVVFTC